MNGKYKNTHKVLGTFPREKTCENTGEKSGENTCEKLGEKLCEKLGEF